MKSLCTSQKGPRFGFRGESPREKEKETEKKRNPWKGEW